MTGSEWRSTVYFVIYIQSVIAGSYYVILADANNLKHRIFIFLCHNHNLFNKSNMSNRADGSYELFYNAAKSIVNDAVLLDEDASVFDKLNNFIVSFDVLHIGSIAFAFYDADSGCLGSTAANY